MDRRQKRLVATIIAVSLSLVGAFAGVIVWSASHRGDSEAKARSAATSPVPSSEAIPSHSATSLPSQVDGYASEFRPTSAQKERAVRAVKAAAQWSQSETQQERFKRLSSEFSDGVAKQESAWEKLYGSVDKARVTVDSTGDASVTSHDGKTMKLGVMVTYTVHIPHGNGSEVVSSGTRLWVAELPLSGDGKVTGLEEPKL